MNDHEYSARVRAMERRLYRIAHAILWCDADCADAIQDAVFKGWMKKNGLQEEKYFETWLIRILINECKSLLRRQKVRSMPLDEAAHAAGQGWPDADMQLRSVLKQLPEKYRMPLLLHHLEGYSLSDIARMLDIPQTLVKSRLHQARTQLRRLLTAGGEHA